MMEAKYNARHAKEILEPCDVLENLVLLDDSGVWPAVERDMLMQAETEVLRWRPARELQSELGAPEVSDTPMLPMPFTGRELAAFMLHGAGVFVAEFYGDWDSGPDLQSLNHINPDSRARMAVVEAFAAYHLAQGLVGKLDIELQNRADALQREYSAARDAELEREKVMEPNDTGLPEAEYRRRLKLAVDSLAELYTEAGRVSDEAKESSKRWLSAMVCNLLNHRQNAPLVAESASEPDWPLMATPDELCAAFGTFTGMNKQWFANVKDAPQLKAARFWPGQGGRNRREPLFYVYPVLQWLIDEKRRKGKPMEIKTGWRMLKAHFPSVYEAYELNAPSTD